MPKERVRKSNQNGFADLLIQWGRDEVGDHLDTGEGRVRLFITAAELGTPGGFYFHPQLTDEEKLTEPDRIGAHGEGIGPVDIMLDRTQINRLIRVLRRARDQAYGRDE